jgi:hypothetical protein
LVRGRTSCAGEEKNKRGRIIGEGSSTAEGGGVQQNYVPPFGGIPAPPSFYGGVPRQAWGRGAAMPPPNFVVPNVAFAGAICTPSSTTTKCGHHWRIRCKKHANYCSLLTDKTRIHLRSASVRTYTFFTTGFPRFLSIRGARGLLALNQVLI